MASRRLAAVLLALVALLGCAAFVRLRAVDGSAFERTVRQSPPTAEPAEAQLNAARNLAQLQQPPQASAAPQRQGWPPAGAGTAQSGAAAEKKRRGQNGMVVKAGVSSWQHWTRLERSVCNNTRSSFIFMLMA